MMKVHSVVLAIVTVFGFSFTTPKILRADEATQRLVLATHKLFNDASTAGGLAVSFGKHEDGSDKIAIVTAHHVLDHMKGTKMILVTRKLREDKQYQRVDVPLRIRDDDGRRLWKKHPKHDIAIFPLPKDINVSPIPVTCFAREKDLERVFVGDSIRAAVYPERLESNNAGFPIVRSGSIASFPLAPIDSHTFFMADITAWGGDSGGPVIHATERSADGLPLVLGLVRGKRSYTETKKESKFVERRTHYSLEISDIVHAAYIWEMAD